MDNRLAANPFYDLSKLRSLTTLNLSFISTRARPTEGFNLFTEMLQSIPKTHPHLSSITLVTSAPYPLVEEFGTPFQNLSATLSRLHQGSLGILKTVSLEIELSHCQDASVEETIRSQLAWKDCEGVL